MSVRTVFRISEGSLCQVRNWAGSRWGLLPGATRPVLSLEALSSDQTSSRGPIVYEGVA
jgi:hypothetical protein